jgi:hypothetical protein
VAIASPFFVDPGMSVGLRLKQTQAFWYQLYFHTRAGRLALEQKSAELCGHLWRTWSPTWVFSPQELQFVLPSFRNPSFPEIVVSYYQHRWGIGNDSLIYEAQQAKLSDDPNNRCAYAICRRERRRLHAGRFVAKR